MADLRKTHNNYKRQLIQKWIAPNSYVLDCGCGRGGDWWKWKAVGVRLVAIDPDHKSLDEAEKRGSVSRKRFNTTPRWALGLASSAHSVLWDFFRNK